MKVIDRLFELQECEMGTKAGMPGSRNAIEQLRKEIPTPILAHYERLTVRGKRGVALVRNGVCTGCQMRLATGVSAAILRDEDIAMCDNCARYLLLDKRPPEAEAAPAKRPTRRRRKTAAEDGKVAAAEKAPSQEAPV